MKATILLLITVIRGPLQPNIICFEIELDFDFDATWRLDAKSPILAMYLMYYLDEAGTRVYTLAKTDPKGNPTFSAHPARFSPEDQVN